MHWWYGIRSIWWRTGAWESGCSALWREQVIKNLLKERRCLVLAEREGRVDEEGSAKRRTGREWPPKPWAGGKSCVSVRPCFMEKSCSSSGWDLAFALAFTYPANCLSPPLNRQSGLPWTHLQVTLPHLLMDLSKTVGPGVKRRDKSRTLWPRQ